MTRRITTRRSKTAQKMHDQRPDDVTAIYNIACIQCLKGEKAKAYEWLEKAVDAGYDDANQLRTDSDFPHDSRRGSLRRSSDVSPPTSEGLRTKNPSVRRRLTKMTRNHRPSRNMARMRARAPRPHRASVLTMTRMPTRPMKR